MTHHNAADTHVALRPIASPLALGFLALGGATATLAGLELGWYPASQSTVVALVAMLFGFPLQLLASIFGFLGRDAVTATGMGILAADWLTVGAAKLLTPPGSTSAALGVLVTFAGVALLIPAVGATFGKIVPALVLYTAAARFVVTGIYQLTASAPVQTTAGVLGLVLLGFALYAALALELEDVRNRTILPLLRIGQGRDAVRGEPRQAIDPDHEAGVRKQL